MENEKKTESPSQSFFSGGFVFAEMEREIFVPRERKLQTKLSIKITSKHFSKKVGGDFLWKFSRFPANYTCQSRLTVGDGNEKKRQKNREMADS